MTEPKTTSIRIEPLNPAHLAQWVQDAPIDQLSRFQGFLIGEWLSRVEQRFPDLLPSRSPRCLMALAGDRPVASGGPAVQPPRQLLDPSSAGAAGRAGRLQPSHHSAVPASAGSAVVDCSDLQLGDPLPGH